MSVQSQTPYNSYTANGATTVFPYTFLLLEAGDLTVTVDGVVKTLTTDYTISGLGTPSGGNVTFLSAPANGAKVLLSRLLTIQRLTDYQDNGDLFAETLNQDLDRIWLALQQLQQNDIRALKLPYDTATDQAVSEEAADRIGKLITFDSSGNMILAVPADLSVYAIPAFMETLLDDTSAAAARATLGLVIGTDVEAFAAAASQAEMEAGTEAALRSMSPLRVAQAIAALGGGSTDQIARDQIALTNMRLMLQTAITTGALVQGKQWELSSDEWGSSSTNETYTSATPNYYSNPAGATSYSNTGGSGNRAGVITVTHNGFTTGTPSQVVDGTISTPGNGCYPPTSTSLVGDYLQFDFGVGASKVIDEAKLYNQSGYSLGGTWQWKGSNNGSTWTNIGGTYNDTTAGTQTIATLSGNTTGYRYYRFEATAGTTGGSVPWWTEFDFKIIDASLLGTPNMTLLPPAAVSLSAVPTYADCYFLWKDDSGSAVLGTDLTVELSRDNGTTYTTATITNLASYDGTYSILRARADVSGQPSGTSMLCRIKTLNNKAQRVAAPALYAE